MLEGVYAMHRLFELQKDRLLPQKTIPLKNEHKTHSKQT